MGVGLKDALRSRSPRLLIGNEARKREVHCVFRPVGYHGIWFGGDSSEEEGDQWTNPLHVEEG